jgi:ABC transporter with metal-binding/Fe-S-binding domain ATP-binding protein
MKLGVLFSGGKDSVYACSRAMERNEPVCLITLVSLNPDSYMFHTPNIRRTDLLAEALEIPQLTWPTSGIKEEELQDLRSAVAEAKERYGIQGLVSGAIESVYQAVRVQRICRELDLWCFNPLWQTSQLDYLRKLLSEGFRIIICGVYAYPFDASWLGAELTHERIVKLAELQKRYKINPSGEGGELETMVLDGPIFHKKIEIRKASKSYANYRGRFLIEDMRLVEK